MNLDDFNVVVFDFDGTLINSEPYHKLAHCKVLSSILNKEVVFNDEEFLRYIGKSDSEIFEMYKTDFDVDFNVQEQIDKKVKLAEEMLLGQHVKIYDYFFDLVKYKDDKRFYIVSNQNRSLLLSVLESKGILGCFDNVFALSNLGISKNYFYNHINDYIDNVEKCIVFEDDYNTLKDLMSIGYEVVAVKNNINSNLIDGSFRNIIDVTE